MVHHRRSRSSQERRERDRWYEEYHNRDRDSDSESESEPEPESLPDPALKNDKPLTYIRQLLDQIIASKDLNHRINLITELLHLFLAKKEAMYSSGEDAYKRFAAIVQTKCMEFAAHPDAIGNQVFQDLLKQVAAAYR
jgi:hypothetical protein